VAAEGTVRSAAVVILQRKVLRQDVARIVVWLRSLGLGRYEAAFRENEIDETVLPSLTHETLKELGVTVGQSLPHNSEYFSRISQGGSDVDSFLTAARRFEVPPEALQSSVRMARMPPAGWRA
jgi:hypothetical protein